MKKTHLSLVGVLLFVASPCALAQTAQPDPALEAYVSLERMLALNERCGWLPGDTLEYAGLSSARDDRLAWLTATGKVLTANLSIRNLPQVVASLPSCTDPQGEALGQQIRGIAGQVTVQWILLAYVMQYPERAPGWDMFRDPKPSADALDPQGRPQWFNGLDLSAPNREKMSEMVLALKNPALRNSEEIAWVEAQQTQALAVALRWGRFSCEPWKGGIHHDAGTCPPIPAEDEQYRDYAKQWTKLVREMALAVSYRD